MRNLLPIARYDNGDVLAVSGTAANSDPVPDGYNAAVIISDVIFHVKQGDAAANPTATTNNFRVPADYPFHIAVQPNEELSFIKASGGSDGNVWIAWVTK
jgi:hypothetical protein